MASFADTPVTLTWGDTEYLDGTATKADGTAQPLTGWTLTFTLKRSYRDADADAVVKKTTTGGGVTITNAPGGLYTVLLLPADTNGLPNREQAFYGGVVGVDASGGVNRLFAGIIRLDPSPVLTP